MNEATCVTQLCTLCPVFIIFMNFPELLVLSKQTVYAVKSKEFHNKHKTRALTHISKITPAFTVV